MAILITGGAGFIGSNFIIDWFADNAHNNHREEPIINVDKLTYAGNINNLKGVADKSNYTFVQGDIKDYPSTLELMRKHRVRAVINFAAESHVDRSIVGPGEFIETNIVGTFNLLEATRTYWQELGDEKDNFRFLHISTDEVYGSLEPGMAAFTEKHPYEPNSPYSASKASSDHLVRAYHHTYGLPTLTTNCSNNYGPYQFPEKLIPLVIHNALAGKALPIYGDGQQVRDWLYVGDHCSAVRRVLELGKPGEVYNIGGLNEKPNLETIETVCNILDEVKPRSGSYREFITYVKDRPGHDRRYAIDSSKIERELGWKPEETFNSGIDRTVKWYLEHGDWVEEVVSGEYRKWIEEQYS